MDPEMLTFYPGGIRVLLLDNDSKFLKTASMLLSLLNFKGTLLWFEGWRVSKHVLVLLICE
jgi:hypothetical protein